MNAINDHVVLVRGLDVTARLTNSVMELSDRAPDGVLLETLIGRYVLDRDARRVWLLIDGSRPLDQLVEGVAEELGAQPEQIRTAVYDLCDRLLDLGLLEIVTPADAAALAQAAGRE